MSYTRHLKSRINDAEKSGADDYQITDRMTYSDDNGERQNGTLKLSVHKNNSFLSKIGLQPKRTGTAEFSSSDGTYRKTNIKL